MTTETVAAVGGLVEIAGASPSRTMGGDERRMLEAARGGLIGQINAYQVQLQTVTAEDRPFWLLLKQGDMIKLAAIEERLGAPRTFVRRKR